MLQPFLVFDKKYIPKLLQLNKHFLVTQSYHRAHDHFRNKVKIDLLITDYDDPGLAKIHLNALKNDRYACILHLDREVHRKKLLEMLSGEQYLIFWSVVGSATDVKKRLDAVYRDKVRKFIDQRTNWRVAGNDTVHADGIEVTFGELFVTLKWRTQKLRIKFEEIEKI